MQAHDSNGERPAQSDSDGRRDAEQRAFNNALAVAFASLSHLVDRKVHIAEPGKPFELSANLTGSGKVSA